MSIALAGVDCVGGCRAWQVWIVLAGVDCFGWIAAWILDVAAPLCSSCCATTHSLSSHLVVLLCRWGVHTHVALFGIHGLEVFELATVRHICNKQSSNPCAEGNT